MSDVATNTSRTSDGVIAHLEKTLESAKESAKAHAANVRKAQRLVSKQQNPDELTYRVAMTSLWADHGEKSVTIERKGPIADLMKDAIAQFLRINNRGDVQARYDVRVLLKSRGKDILSVPLPEKLWDQHTWKAPERR